MSTPQDGLANVIADVSFTVQGGAITATQNRFQVKQSTLVGGDLAAGTAGIFYAGPGIIDVAIDAGKGCGALTPAASLQCEFSVSFDGTSATGNPPMLWTVIEGAASTLTIRIYRFQFFNVTAAHPSIVTAADPLRCTITIRRKKSQLPA